MSKMEDLFPKHIELHLQHNPHVASYHTVQKELERNPGYYGDDDSWVSESQKLKAFETQSFWLMHWYPTTPVGFNIMMACDLEELLVWVKENVKDE